MTINIYGRFLKISRRKGELDILGERSESLSSPRGHLYASGSSSSSIFARKREQKRERKLEDQRQKPLKSVRFCIDQSADKEERKPGENLLSQPPPQLAPAYIDPRPVND